MVFESVMDEVAYERKRRPNEQKSEQRVTK